MKVKLELISKDEKETINIEDVDDPNLLEYTDSYGAKNLLKVFEDGIDIERNAQTHSTNIKLRKHNDSYALISSPEGNIKINVKTLAFEINNDIITLVYSINDEERAINIEYIGA